MRLVAIAAAVMISASALVSYSPSPAFAVENQPKESNTVTVKRGDSLSKIAEKHDTTYQRLFFKNTNIEHPDVIFPGDKVKIPKSDEKLEKRELPADAVVPAAPVAAEPATQAPAASEYTPAPAPAATPAPQRTSSSVQSSSTVDGGVWDRIAQCESGGNWSINTGNGYYGGLQFSLQSWQAVGGSGLPSDASKAEQIARAEKLKAIQGFGAWPACSAKLGLL